MLDIQFIRDNPELVKEKSKQKGISVDTDRLLQLDSSRRRIFTDIEHIRAERNSLAESLKQAKPSSEHIAQGKQLKEKLSAREQELKPIDEEFNTLLMQIPNLPLEDVPVGSSEVDNVVAREWGTKKEFDFKPKTHWQLAEARELIDKERAAKVAGARFAYLKGGLVELQFAIIQFVLQTLANERVLEKLIEQLQLNIPAKAFVPILPPALINTAAYEASSRLDAEEVTYKLADDELWLNASAEHSLCNIYMNEILEAEQLPIRYIGYATSFRREAGSYGKDLEGIIRLHQFDKLEMEVFSSAATGLDEHKLLIGIQEYLMQQLGLPYRVLQKCTADIGKPNARGVDIEAWLSGNAKYLETHTADYMTDYQARRLKTRVRQPDGSVALVHTNDATAFALGRILVAIIENNQTADGHIVVPEILRPFLGGRVTI